MVPWDARICYAMVHFHQARIVTMSTDNSQRFCSRSSVFHNVYTSHSFPHFIYLSLFPPLLLESSLLCWWHTNFILILSVQDAIKHSIFLGEYHSHNSTHINRFFITFYNLTIYIHNSALNTTDSAHNLLLAFVVIIRVSRWVAELYKLWSQPRYRIGRICR